MRWTLAPLTLVLVAGPACAKVRDRCDRAALESIAASLELAEPPAGVVDDAIAGLEAACPNMDMGIGLGLRVSYSAGPVDQLLAVLAEDEAFKATRRAVCARPDEWSELVAEIPAHERAQRMYEVCELERFALFEADERYLSDDYYAVLAHDWMLRHGVEASLARRVTRGLMSATTSPAILEQRCGEAMNVGGCVRLYEGEGIEVPRSTSDGPLRAGVPVTISMTQLRLEGGPTLPLEAGRPAPGALDHRVLTPLWPALVDQAARARALAEDSHVDWDGGLVLIADRRVPMSTVFDVMYTARRAEFSEYQLVVQRAGERQVVRVTPPASWYRPVSSRRIERSRSLVLRGDDQGVHVVAGAPEATLAWDDGAGQRALAKAHVAERPGSRVVELSVTSDVPLDAVIGLLDSLRGEDCLDFGDLVELPETCLVFLPVVSPIPGIPLRAVDWDALELSLSPDSREANVARGPVKAAKLRERLEAALPELRRCLLESEELRVATPEVISFGFAATAEGELGVRVFASADFDAELDDLCLHDAVGASPVSSNQFMATYYADLTVIIDAPPLTGPAFSPVDRPESGD